MDWTYDIKDMTLNQMKYELPIVSDLAFSSFKDSPLYTCENDLSVEGQFSKLKSLIPRMEREYATLATALDIQLEESAPPKEIVCCYDSQYRTAWIYWHRVLEFFNKDRDYFEMRFRCPIASYFEMGFLIMLHEIGHAVQHARGNGLLEQKSYSGYGSRKDHDFAPGEIEADNFAREEMKRLRSSWKKIVDKD